MDNERFSGGTLMETYSNPDYYDIAFGVADAAREVNFFEAAIRAHARVPVQRVFESPAVPRPISPNGTSAATAIAGST